MTEEIHRLRAQGWIVDENARGNGVGVIAVLLPVRRGMERLVLSVLAPSEIIHERAEEIVAIVQEQGGDIFPEQRPVAAAPSQIPARPPFGVTPRIAQNDPPPTLMRA